MSTGDSNVTISIEATDHSAPVIERTERQLSSMAASGVSGMQRLKVATEGYNSALEQLGASAKAGNAQAGQIIAQYKSELDAATASAGTFASAGSAGAAQAAQGFRAAGGAVQGVRLAVQELGLRVPRALESIIARNSTLASALQGTLGIFVAMGAINIGLQLGHGLVELYDKWLDVNGALDEYRLSVEKNRDEDVVNVHSIETARARVDDLTTSFTNLRGLAEDLRSGALSGLGGSFGISPDAIAQLISARKVGQSSTVAGQQGDKVSAESVRLSHELAVAQIEAAHAGDAVLGVQGKITAQLQKQYDLNEENREFQHELELAHGNRSPADSGAEEQAAKDEAAYARAQAERTLASRKETEDLIRLDDEAVNAKLAGISLLQAQESEAIAEITRKYQEQGQSRQAIDRATADTRAKYDADIQKALDAQQQKIEQVRHEAESAGLSGIAKIQSDSSFKLTQINSPAAQRDQSPEAIAAREQESVLAKQKADGDILAEQRRFGEEMDRIVEHNADQVLTGYAKIDAETRRSLSAIADNYKKTYGQLDFFSLAPQDQTTVLQGAQKEGAAISAVQDAAQREKLKYAQDTDRQIAQIEAEAARALLPPWQAAQQKIADDYALRVQKVLDDEQQQLAGVTSDAALTAQVHEQANRQIAAAYQLAQAEMVRQTEQTRDQLAGQLQSFFDNPAKYMQQRAKQVMFEILANWTQQLENNKPRLQGLVGGIFGQNKVGTGSTGHALGQLFGAHGAQGAGSGDLQVAGTSLNAAGLSLQASSQTIYQAALAFLQGAQIQGGTVAGPSGVTAGGVASGTAGAGTAGGFSGESLGLPTGGLPGFGGAPGIGGGGFFSGGAGSTSDLGATGGIGTAAQAAPEIAAAAGGPSGAIGGISATVQQGLQLSSLLHTAFANNGGSAPLLNPNGVAGTPGGFQPTDIPPTNDAGVPGTVPSGGSDAGSIGLAGGALTAITGGFALYGGTKAAYDAPTFASGLAGAGSDALTGAGIGLMFGPEGAAIGAAAGFALGLVADIFGDRGRSKMQHYNTDTIIPSLQKDMDSFSFSGGTYDSAALSINQLEIQAQQQAKQWGTGAMDVYRSLVLPEIQNAESQIEREGAAGRSNVKFGVSQFHGGGVISGFGDLWTSSTEGFIHAKLGERVQTSAEWMREDPRTPGSSYGYGASAGGRSLGQGDNSGDGLHVHVHTGYEDPHGFVRWMRRGGAGDIQRELNQYRARYAGKAEN